MGCVSAKEAHSYDFQNDDSPNKKKKKNREDKRPAWASDPTDYPTSNGFGSIDYGTTDSAWDPPKDDNCSPDKHSHHNNHCDDGKQTGGSLWDSHHSPGHGLWDPGNDHSSSHGGGGFDSGGGGGFDSGGGGGCDSGGGGGDSGGGSGGGGDD